MKKILLVIPVIALVTISIKAYAWDAEEARRKWWERYNQTEEAVKEIIEDENCYNNYSGTIKTTKKTSKKSNSNSNGNLSSSNNSNSYEDNPRGYVYGVDELHVTGLPVDERGYTRAGDYGKIEAK